MARISVESPGFPRTPARCRAERRRANAHSLRRKASFVNTFAAQEVGPQRTLLSVTRRQFLSFPAVFAIARGPGPAQNVFSGVAYRDYSRCLPNYLRDLAAISYHRRNATIAKLTA